MSFILDALRKSEHERQRSTVPGLSQVPLATPQPQMPRWALGVIAALGAAVLALGFAWIYSMRASDQVEESQPPTVERSVELPPPAPRTAAPRQAAPSRPPGDSTLSATAGSSNPAGTSTLSAAAASSTAPSGEGGVQTLSAGSAPIASPQLTPPTRVTNLPDDSVALPSIAMLAAEGVPVPMLHLELHAFSAQPKDRFVFINGRKYQEGDRLAEGPMLVAIEPTGAVLTHAGRRFILVQE